MCSPQPTFCSGEQNLPRPRHLTLCLTARPGVAAVGHPTRLDSTTLLHTRYGSIRRPDDPCRSRLHAPQARRRCTRSYRKLARSRSPECRPTAFECARECGARGLPVARKVSIMYVAWLPLFQTKPLNSRCLLGLPGPQSRCPSRMRSRRSRRRQLFRPPSAPPRSRSGRLPCGCIDIRNHHADPAERNSLPRSCIRLPAQV